jgi:tetratricopeptide (TPR) repeat protein
MHFSRKGRSAIGLLVSIILFYTSPALAQDPFRKGPDARPIGPALESAFEDFFRTGEFQKASQKLSKAQAENPNEPLVYTLQAALAYLNGQRDKMLEMTQKTREVSQAIESKDAARSHLYRGIAQGLEGSSYYLKDGLTGIPKALTYVSSMFLEIDKAKQLAPDDPEVNLLVGYIDTLLNKYDDALQEFRKAGPPYVSRAGPGLSRYQSLSKSPGHGRQSLGGSPSESGSTLPERSNFRATE